jgi:hypothetical protein
VHKLAVLGADPVLDRGEVPQDQSLHGDANAGDRCHRATDVAFLRPMCLHRKHGQLH